MAFPVTRKNEVIGIMAFFTKIKRLPDKEVFDLMADIGRRIGAFINRNLAERALEERSYLAVLGADVGCGACTGRYLTRYIATVRRSNGSGILAWHSPASGRSTRKRTC